MPRTRASSDTCHICKCTIHANGRASTGRHLKTKLLLIPAVFQAGLVDIGLYTNSDCANAFVYTCPPCSTACTSYFTERERGRHLTSPDLLRKVLLEVGWLRVRLGRDFSTAQLTAELWRTAAPYKQSLFRLDNKSRFAAGDDPAASASRLEVQEAVQGLEEDFEEAVDDLERRVKDKVASLHDKIDHESEEVSHRLASLETAVRQPAPHNKKHRKFKRKFKDLQSQHDQLAKKFEELQKHQSLFHGTKASRAAAAPSSSTSGTTSTSASAGSRAEAIGQVLSRVMRPPSGNARPPTTSATDANPPETSRQAVPRPSSQQSGNAQTPASLASNAPCVTPPEGNRQPAAAHLPPNKPKKRLIPEVEIPVRTVKKMRTEHSTGQSSSAPQSRSNSSSTATVRESNATASTANIKSTSVAITSISSTTSTASVPAISQRKLPQQSQQSSGGTLPLQQQESLVGNTTPTNTTHAAAASVGALPPSWRKGSMNEAAKRVVAEEAAASLAATPEPDIKPAKAQAPWPSSLTFKPPAQVKHAQKPLHSQRLSSIAYSTDADDKPSADTGRGASAGPGRKPRQKKDKGRRAISIESDDAVQLPSISIPYTISDSD